MESMKGSLKPETGAAMQRSSAELCCMAAAKQLLGGYDVDQTALNVDHLLDALAC